MNRDALKEQMIATNFNYRFKERAWLDKALCGLEDKTDDFERLEFLGDKILGAVMAHILYTQFPHEREGDLSKRLASLVSGRGLRLEGGRMRDDFAALAKKKLNASLLEDVMEAILGAIYCDGGFDAAYDATKHLYAHSLTQQKNADPPTDAKTSLQEWSLQRGYGLPSYHLLTQQGKSHAPIFTVSVQVGDMGSFLGIGKSKNSAQQKAARGMLERIAQMQQDA